MTRIAETRCAVRVKELTLLRINDFSSDHGGVVPGQKRGNCLHLYFDLFCKIFVKLQNLIYENLGNDEVSNQCGISFHSDLHVTSSFSKMYRFASLHTE